jgi:tight adherence protein C
VVIGAFPRSPVIGRLAVLRPAPSRHLQKVRGLALISSTTLRSSGLAITIEQLAAAKIACAMVAALLASVVAIAVPIGAIMVAAAAYVGFILPSVVVERRVAARAREAEAAVASLVEWAHALVQSGRPADSAIVTLARRGTGVPLVDEVLANVADQYTLGAPLHAALARESREVLLPSLTLLAERLARSRELGIGSIQVLADLRDELRMATRDRFLRSASQVEGKMTLLLTLCYLPALTLLVVIPLFMTLLAGLFG